MKNKKKIGCIMVVCIALLFTGCGSNKATTSESAATAITQIPKEESKNLSKTDAGMSFNTEEYDSIQENNFSSAAKSPLSTFSIDVDTASYSNVRRFLSDGQLPPRDAVRIEEFINYFDYSYPEPKGNVPFSISTEISRCPWNENHYLTMIGLQGKKLQDEAAPNSNLVFLLDVSGSMDEPNKLPLLKSAFKMLTNKLKAEDRVSIVVYAGAAGVVLDSAKGSDTEAILGALEQLQAGGSTAGSEGIARAYEIAKDNFIEGGNNRVILATDGDFNVGVSSESDLIEMIEKKRDEGIFLSVLGFGTGNYKDSKMEALADKGNGNYAYIDNLAEAKKVLVKEMGSTLYTIAKDVKIQVEFNPEKVKEYRLVGYENRLLSKEDFNDDSIDAGELGSGHTVTAFYELIPANSDEVNTKVDDLKYQDVLTNGSQDWLTVKLRYKDPDSSESQRITKVVDKNNIRVNPSDNFVFASAVSEFGMLLRDSEFKGTSSYEHILESIDQCDYDTDEYRSEFVKLVKTAKNLDPQ